MLEVTIPAAFIAGLLMFLAPCTFPVVPGYLGFISGVSASDLRNPKIAPFARRRIIFNAIAFLLGFSIVVILVFGTISFAIGEIFNEYRFLIARIGGIFIIAFGLMMTGILKMPFLKSERRLQIPSFIKVGNPISSFFIGSIFAFGWSPCVGPIFGIILNLAAVSETAFRAIFLLIVFSFGLSAPFMAVAIGFASATKYMQKISKYLNIVSIIGGIFLVLLGFLILTNNLVYLIQYSYKLLEFVGYDSLKNRL